MERVENIVIGAGVVGLAITHKLASSGHEVILIEAEGSFGQHTSSRNSQVIHAGLHYPPTSLKAQLCIRGKNLLYNYCKQYGIDHQMIGKITVAGNDEEVARLESIKANAEASGVDDLYFLPAAELQTLEPELKAVSGLFSPSSGIVDSHGLMLSLLDRAETAAANIAFKSPFIGATVNEGYITVEVGGHSPMTLQTKNLINCAGLRASEMAHNIRGLASQHIPKPLYAKGNYFTCSGAAPFKHLIYPVPIIGGLGIHYTLDANGQARFGPDVQWVDKPDYNVSTERKDMFVKAISKYWPNLDPEKLTPDYAGVRPKIGPKSGFTDFQIQGEETHGVKGLINLFGIDSPGLTSSLAIAEEVVGKLEA